MLKPATPWSGREDPEDGALAVRWHDRVRIAQTAEAGGARRAILGFASDEGVRRNKGRAGAGEGPAAIRKALSNLAWHHGEETVADFGDIVCEGEDLEAAHEAYATRLAVILAATERTLVLGGGHEIAYGTFLGFHRWAARQHAEAVLGIVNLDQHLDLRRPGPPGASSGTPFLQISEVCRNEGRPFHYCCLGLARTGNTSALFARADELGVTWRLDAACRGEALAATVAALEAFLDRVDFVYLTLDLDVLPASLVSAVSSPAVVGVPIDTILRFIDIVKSRQGRFGPKCVVADIAEYNPSFDATGVSGRTAALLADHILF